MKPEEKNPMTDYQTIATYRLLQELDKRGILEYTSEVATSQDETWPWELAFHYPDYVTSTFLGFKQTGNSTRIMGVEEYVHIYVGSMIGEFKEEFGDWRKYKLHINNGTKWNGSSHPHAIAYEWIETAGRYYECTLYDPSIKKVLVGKIFDSSKIERFDSPEMPKIPLCRYQSAETLELTSTRYLEMRHPQYSIDEPVEDGDLLYFRNGWKLIADEDTKEELLSKFAPDGNGEIWIDWTDL
jgi:hypothetical protein